MIIMMHEEPVCIEVESSHSAPLEIEHNSSSSSGSGGFSMIGSKDDGDDNHSIEGRQGSVRRKNTPQQSWRVTVARYVSLATIAFLLTLTCPGETSLWVAEKLHWKVVTQVIAVYALTVAAFFVVHFSDPGFLTAEMLENLEDEQHSLLDDDDDEEEEKKDEEQSFDPLAPPSATNTDTVDDDGDPLSKANTNDDEEHNNNNNEYYRGTRRKPCETCHLAPPLRSHHCKVCNRCVATFDHHCEMLGVCIGERNHARFFGFLLIQFLFGFYSCSRVVGSSKLGWSTLLVHDAFSWEAVRVILAEIYLYPLTGMAAIVLGIHTFLALVNMTTFEFSKGPRHLEYLKGTRNMDLPFNRGLVQNVTSFCRRDAIMVCHHRSPWTPTLWRAPGKIVRDSEDWWEHPWQNKYWSCC